MGSKQKIRRRPAILQEIVKPKHDDYPKCATPGCHNVVAVWSNYSYCSWCRR